MMATWLVSTGGRGSSRGSEVDEEREPGTKHDRHSADTWTLPYCVLFHLLVYVMDGRMRMTTARSLVIARDGLVGVVAVGARPDGLGMDTLLRGSSGQIRCRWTRDGIAMESIWD